jgi:RimJ/RimL family protein N-acetyltransferase
MSVLLTERLRLRPAETRDRDAFVAMNLDPEVMHFFAGLYPAEKSDEHLARYAAQLARDGFSFLTLEYRETCEYLGLVGMQVMTVAVPNLPQPAVEIGWRLTRAAQGHGYATEAAGALVDHAFNTLHLPEVVAIIATGNVASQRVATKLGMTQRPELTFTHPLYEPGQPHARHYVYSLTKETSCSTPL